MTDRELLELAELRRILDYDQETGLFTWLVSTNRKVKAGALTGESVNSDGYKQLSVNKKAYKAHRLAWFYVTGTWPDQIDHLNGIRTDNRFCNLRSVSAKLNSHNQKLAHKNNSLGVQGVIKKSSGKYAAEIRVNNKKVYLGTFDSIEQASAAYKTAKLEMHEGAIP